GTTTTGTTTTGTTATSAGDDTTTRDLSQLPGDQRAGGTGDDTVGIDREAAHDRTVPVGAVPTPPATDGAMTRSEEQLRVATERYAAKRVRVVKYVVTEEVQVTVPIRREEIRIEEVPLGDGAPATTGALDTVGTGGLPETIVLHTERPVVGTEVVPVERVRLRTEWVQEQVQVRDQVRRERVDVDRDRMGQDRMGQDRL
ncbi:conserved domain-containing protein, partial [Geodermatophilus obscurus]